MSVTLEELYKFTPLGIRLWDPVFDRQISDALTVSIHPLASVDQKVYAYRTIGDVYTFSHIRGLWDIEFGLTQADAASPPDTRQYVVNISDRSRRYNEVSFLVGLPLPYQGVFLSNHNASPSTTAPKGLYLYSSPMRVVPGWMALVRGELVNQSSGQPAAWALLKLTAEGGETHYGIADAKGRFIVMFAYPVLVEGFGGSPSTPGHRPLSEQSWNLDLEVFYSPGSQISQPGSEVPDYVSILTQQSADIWTEQPGPGVLAVAALPVQLEFRKAIIVRTEGLSALLVSPDESSP